MRAYRGMTSIVPGQPPGSASSGLQVASYYFWCKNWNPDPNKPTFSYTWRHIRGCPLYLYLAGLQDQPPAASRWPDIIFDARIEILTLINLLLDIHDGILGDDLYICTWPASRISLQLPPAASRGPDIIFYARIEILTITNLPLDIHDGILGVTSISVPGRPPGSASSGLQVA